nr:immunoglobulin heavy chain junction region [Macaca mulatta]MOY21405.1 immunoglobulin heavy chain junction region [Macaca mulatta]MOY21494.1 immunoglobulin heavy chain junction region [Macaca mulatta]MOY22200.1 immunoglobulin heavy chain junction region [Macaca mulatta]MOY22532.1 immunoglobulin heavy chain junction region [Macaca mulatta]
CASDQRRGLYYFDYW